MVSTWLLAHNGTVVGTQELDWRCDRASGCSTAWRPIGAGDMTGDGAPDIVWFNETTGEVASWLRDAAARPAHGCHWTGAARSRPAARSSGTRSP